MAGKPSTFDQRVFDAICERMAAGELVVDIVETTEGYPSLSALHRWKDADPALREAYARARVMQAHACAERAVRSGRRATSENAAAARVQFDADRWLASKLAHNVYGERVQQQHSGDPDNPVVTEVRYRWDEPAKDKPE